MNSDILQYTFFDSKAEMWDRQESAEKLERLGGIFSQLRIKIRKRVLDVGSGTGILVPVIFKYTEPEATVWEFDLSVQMIFRNRQRWNLSNNSLLYVNGDSHHLPFFPESFDFVVCFAVLPHLTDREKAIREWWRVLTPGGRLLILHLMSSFRLNQMHTEADPAVQNDYLPPINEMVRVLSSCKFTVGTAQEQDDLYLLLCEK